MTRSQKPPLDGILVADFSRVLAGPLCTQLLSDFGARVIKIEEPVRGDETRRWGPPFLGDVSTYFLSVNRGKESLTLDLSRGNDVVERLLDRADVVVDNFLPRQRARLLGDIRKRHPRIVHCSIAGYDSDTPLANTSGYDLLAQAESGLMSITGEADGDPMKVGVALADVLTAHHAFGAICAALAGREKSGEGTSIEVSLFSSTISSLVNVAQGALATRKEARRYGNEHASIVPYQVFHGSDRPFAVGAGTDRHFEALCCEVIDQPDLATDRRFATNAARVKNRRVLIPMLEDIFRGERAAKWVARCRRAAIPAALVRGVREALQSPEAQRLIGSIEHPQIGSYEALRSPARLGGERPPLGSAPPELGQHTDAILKQLGYSRRDIDSLRRTGVIGQTRISGE
ncbi:MAG: CaiB/BaiF CoA transferase family protein [Thermoanaerobaculia bacterium]